MCVDIVEHPPALNKTNRHLIRESGGIEHLIRLLMSENATVQENAAWALKNLGTLRVCVLLPVSVPFVLRTHPPTSVSAMTRANQDHIRESGGLEVMLDLLETENQELLSHLVWGLTNLSCVRSSAGTQLLTSVTRCFSVCMCSLLSGV